ncbi:MAG: alpha/beta hydrolase [Anaerolineales bacterium]|nr:alpha/beta hydrolase [Anaerolineales bacterium]
MGRVVKALILLGLITVIGLAYVFPGPSHSFERIYADVAPQTVVSLQAFRSDYQPIQIDVTGATWEYILLGEGEQTILFLHGMSGAYDIWWQQIEMLKDRYRLLAVTYPAVDSLGELSQGIFTILDQEGIDTVNLVGSSLGGYLAQYLIAVNPDRVRRAVFANTFPPNDIIADRYKLVAPLLPYLPVGLIMTVVRINVHLDLYPASGHSELTKAYLLEQSYGGMSKAQFVARYRCVVDAFSPPDIASLNIPVMIIESDNDPLLDETLRRLMKETYPPARIVTLSKAGHFPYLNIAGEYTRLLEGFLE